MDSSAEQRQKPDLLASVERFLGLMHLEKPLESAAQKKDLFSDLLLSILKVDRVEPGRISCSLTVNATVANLYNTLHGGAVASVAEMVSLACAKTAAGDKDFSLGESNTSYLSAAKLNDTVQIDGSVLRQGRSVVVTTVDFRNTKNGNLLYTSRLTFYIMPGVFSYSYLSGLEEKRINTLYDGAKFLYDAIDARP